MSSTILDPVAAALKTLIEGVSVSPTMRAHKWTPKDLGKSPVGVVGIPRGSRSGVDEAETQLGSEDWNLTYVVALFFDLAEAGFTQAQAVEYVEAFITAVDDNPTLTGTVLDAKVTNFEPELVEDRNRPLLSYVCDVEVLKLVAT